MTPDATAELVIAIRELTAEIRSWRAESRHPAAIPAFMDAIEAHFGATGRFTAGGLLALADEEPHGAIGETLAGLIDVSAAPRSRATSAGALLAGLARRGELEIVAERDHAAVYALRRDL